MGALKGEHKIVVSSTHTQKNDTASYEMNE